MAIKIETRPFGRTKNGEAVTLYEIHTPNLIVRALDYGATIQSVLVKDRYGNWVDVVLGYDTLDGYQTHAGYLGACVGRVANRIADAQFSLNGKTYVLARNNGRNHLHGGLRGFDKYVWSAEVLRDGVRFSRVSPDGEEGYPGNLNVSVSYRMEDDALDISYDAVCDQDTICNLTNHSYWNLNGSGTALHHILQINASQYLENSADCMPTGKILPVEGTPFDFRMPKEVGCFLEQADEHLRNRGYDHNFCLPDDGMLHDAAVLSSTESGITMKVCTTMPGVQLYTANALGTWTGKDNQVYHKHDAVCLETQFYPNAMACKNFRKPILRVGTCYHHVTKYAFSQN